MIKLNFNKIRSMLATPRPPNVIGAVAILAVFVLLAIGSVQAAGPEQHQTITSGDDANAKFLLVATDAFAANEALGIPQPADPNSAHYYTEIDIRPVAAAAYSQELADWIETQVHPLDFVFGLADEEEVVLMPGGGFDAPKSSVRASLANLDDAAYTTAIGKRLREPVDEYYQRRKAAQEEK